MSTMLEFDTEGSRRIEAVYTTRDVVEQRRAVLEMLAIRPGESALDIGVGPGFLAAEIAAAVGRAGRVCGIDISDSMLALARARVPTDQVPVELRHGEAVHIPHPDSAFDVAVSTQVLEYVSDIPTALSEIHRVLRPGGRVLILDTDWDSIVWHSNDEQRMDRVLAAWEEHLADPHLPRTLRHGLERAGLAPMEPRVIPLLNVGYEAATYSGGLIDIVADFVAGRAGLTAADVDGWREDLRSMESNYFFSLNRYVFRATRPA